MKPEMFTTYNEIIEGIKANLNYELFRIKKAKEAIKEYKISIKKYEKKIKELKDNERKNQVE